MSERRQKIRPYRDNAGLLRWQRVGTNGEIISDSGESFTTEEALQENIELQREEFDVEPLD